MYCGRFLPANGLQSEPPPPVLFTELADAVLEGAVKPAVDALLEKMRKAAESGQ